MTTYSPGTEVKIVGNYLSCITDAKIGSVAKMTSGVLRDSGLYEVEYEGNSSKTYVGFIHPKDFELINTKPTKNQRISALEKEVAELKKLIQANPALIRPQFHVGVDLASGKDVSVITLTLNNNQKRAAIIEKAKRALAEQLPFWNAYDNEFVINTEKRTVVLLRKDLESGKVKTRGIAKCHPKDVFNEDIGKIIAFGRATGYPTKEFEQAVQPDEVVVGMVVASSTDSKWKPFEVARLRNDPNLELLDSDNTWVYADRSRITNDTSAQY